MVRQFEDLDISNLIQHIKKSQFSGYKYQPLEP